jgi:hypothetical protein
MKLLTRPDQIGAIRRNHQTILAWLPLWALLLFLVFFLAASGPTAQANTPPPDWPVDVKVNFRIYCSKEYSDYLFYVNGTKRSPEQIKISTDKPVVLQGNEDGELWLAAVPLELVKTLGDEENLAKSLAGD